MKSVVISFLVAASSFGTEVFNVGMQARVEYADLFSHCKLSALVEPYRFAAEVEEGRVIRARLSRKVPDGESISYEFNEEELYRIEIREEGNLKWLKVLPLSSEILSLLIYSGKGFGADACVPPSGIASLVPSSNYFDFGVEEVGYLLPHLISSNEIIVKGKTHAANPYQIKLSLVQDRR